MMEETWLSTDLLVVDSKSDMFSTFVLFLWVSNSRYLIVLSERVWKTGETGKTRQTTCNMGTQSLKMFTKVTLQGASQKMCVRVLKLKSVIEVGFFLLTCVSDSKYWTCFIKAFKNGAHSESENSDGIDNSIPMIEKITKQNVQWTDSGPWATSTTSGAYEPLNMPWKAHTFHHVYIIKQTRCMYWWQSV